MLRYILLLFLSLLILPDSHTQCTIHGVDGGNTQGNIIAGNYIGQTFMACQTGVITSISVSVGASSLGTAPGLHNLRIGPSTNPPTSIVGGPVYQTFNTSGGAETITINLNQPFPVTNGSIYAFDIEVGAQYEYIVELGGGDYPGGNIYAFTGGFLSFSTADLDFEVQIQPNPIPALGEWSILLLGLTLFIFGSAALKQEAYSVYLK